MPAMTDPKFLAIMAVVMFALYLVYLAARPFLEARAKCWKCPEEEGISIKDTDTVQRIQGSDAANDFQPHHTGQ